MIVEAHSVSADLHRPSLPETGDALGARRAGKGSARAGTLSGYEVIAHMKQAIRLVAVLAAAACALASLAQGKDPAEVLKDIAALRTKRASEAREANKPLDVNGLNAEIKAMALEATAGVDPAKVDAAQAYDWAQVFSYAGKHKETCDLCAKFVASNPAPERKFSAQMLMLTSCNELGEGEMILMALPDVVLPNWSASQQLLRATLSQYAGTILVDKGLDAALKAIDDVASRVQYESPEDYANRVFAATKARNPKNPDGTPQTDEQIRATLLTQGKGINDSLKFSVVSKKASLLSEGGRKSTAVALLDSYIAEVGADSAYGKRASTTRTQLTIVGAVAPELVYDRKIGEFPGLQAWRGKVVIVDFTAHW